MTDQCWSIFCCPKVGTLTKFGQQIPTCAPATGPNRLLKNSYQCHPEVAPVLRDRRIFFAYNTRKQQILRYTQDDTLTEQFFSSPLDILARYSELAHLSLQSGSFQA